MKTPRLAIGILSLALFLPALARASDLVVHEWGTFTSFQDETGLAFTGINAEDEPLPDFCHKIQWNSAIDRFPSKAVSRGHPDITMRLETPVIYFHPSKDMKLPFNVDVHVQFRNGWLTQFYPNAQVGATGLKVEQGKFKVEYLADEMTGSLTWRNLQVGATGGQPPDTNLHVWTAPRKVDGAMVAGPNGETEKYVFYRGVGRLNAPIRLERKENQLALFSQLHDSVAPEMRLQKLWLVDFREDGLCAYRRLQPLTLPAMPKDRAMQKNAQPLVNIDARFTSDEYKPVKNLREDMKAALIEDGLFADEAEALLSTWELSYFKSGGARLFFLVPRAWTDHYLPLTLSVPSTISRTMVGRIEIVTPEQRQLLARIEESNDPAEQLRCYRAMGRFREVLVARQLLYHGSQKLGEFIKTNHINIWGELE